MQRIAAAQTRGDFEMQFSIGRLPTAPDPEAYYTLALAADRTAVLGFCSWLPIYAVTAGHSTSCSVTPTHQMGRWSS